MALGAAIAPLPEGWQLAIGLGAGLLVLAALEGMRVLLFPRRVLKLLAKRYPTALARQGGVDVFEPELQPASAHKPQSMQSTGAPRRWQRPQPVKLGSRDRRARQPQR